MAPILLSLTAGADGQAVAVWSVAPGRRVRMVVDRSAATPDGLALIAASVLPLLSSREDAQHDKRIRPGSD